MTVTRPLSRALTVCAATVPATAKRLRDFVPYRGCVTIPEGETTASFTVHVRGDRVTEMDETLTLAIVGLNASVRAVDSSAAGTIHNDD